MEEIRNLLNLVLNIELIRAILSNPRSKDGVQKMKVRPVEKNGELLFQLERFTKTQAFHENLPCGAAAEKLLEEMEEFKQLQIETVSEEYTVLVSKKGKVSVKKKKKKVPSERLSDISHNRKKQYILEEGKPVPFLLDLGVMTSEGKIVRTKTDKFRQMNRFLEFIEDILPKLDKDRELTILDFGCGKSYLTFAMYYYLHELKGYDIRIIGLDLKVDVIAHCSALAEKYGYDKLSFLVGDIADYEGVDKVDMVVTLHACDTATDYALAKAVGWDAEVILSVPCCQHELNGQLKGKDVRKKRMVSSRKAEEDSVEVPAAEVLAPVLDYGLLKERFAALVTDGLRAKYLESEGYAVQVLEFIDMEHTPKNILLRAVKKGKNSQRSDGEIKACEEFLNVSLTLGKLFEDKGEIEDVETDH